jgi:hypothetical protein
VIKRLLPIILIIIIAGLLVVIGLLLGGKKAGPNPPLVTEKSEVSAHTVIKEALPIGEYASLAYHYTSVIKDINARDIRGWTIPFTTRKYIFTYDGTMKLGIDGSRIQVEEVPAETESAPSPETAENAGAVQAAGTAQSTGAAAQSAGTAVRSAGGLPLIRITLPPVIILSHEIIEDSVEVFEQSQTIFNEIKIEDAFKITAERKREMEQKVLSSSAVNEAKLSAEQQFGALFRSLPGIRDNYEIVFVWQDGAPVSQAAASSVQQTPPAP